MYDVMISYSHKDKQSANMMLAILEQNGIKCWIDYRDALPGKDYAGSIFRAIQSSKYLVVLLSENSNKSQHVLNEIEIAVSNQKTIIPFKIDGTGLNDSFAYYLSKTHWLDALTPPMEKHLNQLVEIIRRYDGQETSQKNANDNVLASKESGVKSSGIKGCRMVKMEELLAMGYTAAKIAEQLVANDYVNCNGIGMENEGTADQWEEFLQDNSDTFQYLIDEDGQIVGDWSIVALSDETFAEAEKGELLEADISIDNTRMICFPDTYNGYILTFSLLPNYRNMTNYNKIIDSFLKQIEDTLKTEYFLISGV